VAIVVALLLALVPSATASSPGCRGVTDNILCMPLPHGWHGSVGFGGSYNQPIAWIVAGNFRLSSSATSHKGGYPVPPHRIKVAIGDFPEDGIHWRIVRRLRLPDRLSAQHTVQMGVSYWSLTRRVRFAGRSIVLAATFGSRPNARLRALANARPTAVHLLHP